MNKTFLIFKHESSHVLKRKGFIIMTLIVPLLFLIAILAMQMVSGAQPSKAKTVNIGYVDESGSFLNNTVQGSVNISHFNTKDEALKAINDGDIEDYFVIPKDYITSGVINLYSLKKELSIPDDIQTSINNFLIGNMLSGLPQTTINRVQAPAAVVPITLTTTGAIAPNQGGNLNFIIPAVFSLLFAMSMVFSSTYMLRGLGEEKENRMMEVLLSSVSHRQLLTGKVLGLSTAGFVQVAVWVASLPLLMKLAASSIGGFADAIQLPPGFLVFGVIYFILGYLLFAVLAAGIGAISSSAQEGQQLSTIYSVFAIIPLWCMGFIVASPDSPIWTVLTIFPLTSPAMVMERLGMINIPTWEIVVSIIVLVLSIIGGLLLAAKIFKTSLLSYGKRSKLKEILHNLKDN